MISASAKAHRQKLIDELQSSTPKPPTQTPADYWFLNQPAPAPQSAPSNSVTFGTQVVAPGAATDNAVQTTTPTVDEEELVHELETHKEEGPTSSYYGHLRTIQPLSVQKEEATKKAAEASYIQAQQVPIPPPPLPPVTPTQQAAILQLASNDDLNVATIAREAKRNESDDEVVIKLH